MRSSDADFCCSFCCLQGKLAATFLLLSLSLLYFYDQLLTSWTAVLHGKILYARVGKALACPGVIEQVGTVVCWTKTLG